MGTHLMGVHLMDVHLIGVYHMGVHLMSCILIAEIANCRSYLAPKLPAEVTCPEEARAVGV